jgi:ATP-binding cassette, subfamily B, multidrug efflux pump
MSTTPKPPEAYRPPASETRGGPASGRMPGGFGMPAEKSKDFKSSARRLVQRLRPERLLVVTVLGFGVISVVCGVIGPKILGHATDIIFRGVRSKQGVDFGALRRTIAQAVVLFVASSVLAYLQSFLLAGAVQRTMRKMRSDVEDKLNRLPLPYVDRQPRGDLLSRVTNDIDNIAQSLQQTLSQLLISIMTLIGVIIMMVIISPLLALVAIITIPLSIVIMRGIAARSRERFKAQWMHTGMLNAQVEEAFTGHAIVKAFGRHAEVEERFRQKNEELYEASFWAQFISGIIQPSMMFLGNLNYVAIAVIGGLRVAAGAISLGDVQAFISYSRQFTQPLTQVASMMNVLQSGIASAERVFQLLDADDQTTEEHALTSDEPHGRVEFRNVSFAYSPERPLIQDLSLVAQPGQTIAIVGPTGAGKTTLVNLIMRFYEVDAGTITLDGVDIATLPRAALRSNVGMVLQDTWLFKGTIRENIAYGNLDASDEEIMAAAKATYVDRFVHSLPDGYDTTIIDDEGGAISAGEKQLLTIARAFLSDPAMLILDEATSSVDTRTELLIRRAMTALRSERTSFVIAHRLSTIRDADLILVMEAGRIVEQGNHEQLLAANGAYATLYNAQFTNAAASE